MHIFEVWGHVPVMLVKKTLKAKLDEDATAAKEEEAANEDDVADEAAIDEDITTATTVGATSTGGVESA
ncbi:hypothetical protein LTR22_025035 [Elasticomyces elasticus]|nr:hypothetical protein LTR22_025035 [Elasticomyces elasticus]